MIPHDITWLSVTLVALATYRLTMLITRDDITAWWRNGLQRRFTGSFVNFWFCPWCVSMWVAAGTVVLGIYFWPVWQWFCFVFAASGVAGFLSEKS